MSIIYSYIDCHQPCSQIIILRFSLPELNQLIPLNYHHRLKKLLQYALGEQSMKSCIMTVEQ